MARPIGARLNRVRPRRPEQSMVIRFSSFRGAGLNRVRPRRPEQCAGTDPDSVINVVVSIESGLEGRNNIVSAAG